MRKFSFIKYCFLTFLFSGFFQVASASAYSLVGTGGASKIAGKAGYATAGLTNPVSFLTTRAGAVVAIALSLVGVIFLVLMIYGGFLWMTDRGSEAQVKKAQTIIYQAVIGLLIVISAYAITLFIGSTFKF